MAEVQPIYRSVRGSQSGVPLLTPKMQAGQDSDGGVVGLEGMCTLHAVVVLWVCLGETWTVVETFLNTR